MGEKVSDGSLCHMSHTNTGFLFKMQEGLDFGRGNKIFLTLKNNMPCRDGTRLNK